MSWLEIGALIIRAMLRSDRSDRSNRSDRHSSSNTDEVASGRSHACREEAMICERCGKAEMYRMHAVWRCPECGFKTDCCGW
jgi:predicted RNA-binding Zn-ribbon protein involved in translation (DUF1610 family)